MKEKYSDILMVCEEALERALPKDEERSETLRFSRMIVERLSSELCSEGLKAEVQLQGSIAKDTWLSGEKDIDVFILLPKSYPRSVFRDVLEVVKRVAGDRWVEAYAEHPYIEARINGYRVDFVPSFKIERSLDAKSSVDRTQLHTRYVKERLNDRIRREIILLKRFMHGIGVYGAEIKVGGFSGYLCEILTLHYGSFIRTIEAASKWRRREIIDIEGYYRGREEDALRIFQDNLIVIDPVDRRRNIASSVSEERLNEFIAASRRFMENPSINFFYPDNPEALSADALLKLMRRRGTSFIFLKVSAPKVAPDILWGQIYKSRRALRKLLIQHDFSIVRDGCWSDEERNIVFLFELDRRLLPSVKRHVGPPILKVEDSERFLHKHLGSSERLSGPYIEGERWIVEVKRNYRDAASLLKDKLKSGGRSIGVASLISEELRKNFDVMADEEIIDFYRMNSEFAIFLTEYLDGRPRWLR